MRFSRVWIASVSAPSLSRSATYRSFFSIVHYGFLQENVHAFRVQALLVRHIEQRVQHVAAELGGSRLTGYAKVITAACDLDIEAALDLPQVFIELATQIGQTGIVGGLENDVSRNLDCVQDECFRPLIKDLQQTTAMRE